MAIPAAVGLLLPFALFLHQQPASLRGCLLGEAGKLYLASSSGEGQGEGEFYLLVGNTSVLRNAIGKEIAIQGNSDPSTDPYPSFQVNRLEHVFERSKPALAAAFTDKAHWHDEATTTAGIQLGRPDSILDVHDSSGHLQPNFIADQNVVTITRWDIPRDVFPHTNFVGGSLAIFLNPAITTAKACSAFRVSGRSSSHQARVAGIQYTQVESGGAAAGTSYHYRYLHTFQNSQCYEVGFEFIEYSTGNEDLGCRVPVMRPEDELQIINPILTGLTFRPAGAQ